MCELYAVKSLRYACLLKAEIKTKNQSCVTQQSILPIYHSRLKLCPYILNIGRTIYIEYIVTFQQSQKQLFKARGFKWEIIETRGDKCFVCSKFDRKVKFSTVIPNSREEGMAPGVKLDLLIQVLLRGIFSGLFKIVSLPLSKGCYTLIYVRLFESKDLKVIVHFFSVSLDFLIQKEKNTRILA